MSTQGTESLSSIQFSLFSGGTVSQGYEAIQDLFVQQFRNGMPRD
jgi:hypothetical protein